MIKSVIYGRDDYPPRVREILKKYGDKNIRSLELYRTPIRAMIAKALDYLSNGKVSALPYDKLFHLALKVSLENGPSLIVEKNEVINIAPFRVGQDSESMPISEVPNSTLSQFLENCKNKMGYKFFRYQANSNNCQHFQLNLLQSNNLLNETYRKFIKQDTASIFENNPALRKLVNTATDTLGRLDVIKQGAGLKPRSQSVWIQHVKKVANEKKITFAKALKLAKETYKK